ncbi:MAG: LPS assembly protein LptD [Acidobacteriota bacterium]
MRRVLLILLLLAGSASAWSQITPIPWRPKTSGAQSPAAKPGASLPPGRPASPATPEYLLTFDRITTVSPGVFFAEGNVRFVFGEMLLTADAVTYDSEAGAVRAEGRVAVDFGDFTVSGSLLEYDLNLGTGSVKDAYGLQKNGDFTVTGREIRKTGPDWYEVVDGTLTSCTAATPPWSVRLSRGRFHVDHYAFLRNPRFRVRSVPALYLPYVVWPLKPERSTGLLIPDVGSSSRKGTTVSTALYLAPGDWWDETLYADWYEEEGWGVGSEFRYALTERSYGWARAYHIRQESDRRRRWEATWSHLQDFRKGWYAVADVNLLSDIDFPKEYERDYTRGTLSRTDSRIFLGWRRGAYSLLSRVERRRQYFTDDRDLIQRALPLVEFRSSLQPFGRGLYAGFETSAGALHKEWVAGASAAGTDKYSMDYGRADLHPFVEWPLHPAPWLDFTPRVEGRATYYGEGVDPVTGGPEGGDLWRTYARASLDVSGPRLFRRFGSGLKHVVEPFLNYTYISGDSDAVRLPLYDEVDQVSLDLDLVKYGVRNRLYGKKGSLRLDAELYQSWRLNGDLTFLGGRSSPRSPVVLAVRFWPLETWSGDLRLSYNPLARRLASKSLSVTYRPREKEKDAFVRITYLKAGALGGFSSTSAAEELRLAAYLDLLEDRITLNPVLERDLRDHDWRNLRLIFWYRGSCYSIGFEAGRRTIGSFRDTNYRLLVSLKGAGTVVDLYGGTAAY